MAKYTHSTPEDDARISWMMEMQYDAKQQAKLSKNWNKTHRDNWSETERLAENVNDAVRIFLVSFQFRAIKWLIIDNKQKNTQKF